MVYTLDSDITKDSTADMLPANIMEDIGINSSTVLIPDSVDSIHIDVPIVDDQIPEIDEMFTVRLSSVRYLNISHSLIDH